MTGFIGLFVTQRVITSYSSHTYSSVDSHVFTAVAWQRLSAEDSPLPVGSRTVTGLRYQLLSATAHND
jgi:hypothetical protein